MQKLPGETKKKKKEETDPLPVRPASDLEKQFLKEARLALALGRTLQIDAPLDSHSSDLLVLLKLAFAKHEGQRLGIFVTMILRFNILTKDTSFSGATSFFRGTARKFILENGDAPDKITLENFVKFHNHNIKKISLHERGFIHG